MPQPATFSPLRTEIAGQSVNGLADRFGTPTFVYDAAKIIERIGDLRSFDVIRYAQKACSNIAILDLFRRHGVLIDAVSAGEIRRALAAGYQATAVDQHAPPPLVYTADIFDADALNLVVEKNIHVNCGSADMIDQLGQRAPGRHISLRINPGFGHGHSQKTNTGGEHSKHGIWHADVADCLRRADTHGLCVSGLHMHIGSGTDLEHLRHVCQAMEKTAREVGRTVVNISAGGGLPVPYRAEQSYVDLPAYFKLWDETRRRLEDAFGHKLTLEIEPGRYLVAEAGYLIAEIRAVKQMGANTFYVLDAGFNNLARPILYGAYHPMSVVPRNGNGSNRALRDVVVGGPLCESGDIFTQQEGGFVCTRSLPAAEVGEKLVLEVAGAYGFVMSSNYNGKPMAAEVLINAGQAHLIRARQTFDDLIRGEKIPPG
jgi:diaminopimelate decarboxylase